MDCWKQFSLAIGRDEHRLRVNVYIPCGPTADLVVVVRLFVEVDFELGSDGLKPVEHFLKPWEIAIAQGFGFPQIRRLKFALLVDPTPIE